MIFCFPSPEPVLLRPLFLCSRSGGFCRFFTRSCAGSAFFLCRRRSLFCRRILFFAVAVFNSRTFRIRLPFFRRRPVFRLIAKFAVFRGKGLTLLVLAFIYFGHDFAVVFGILAKNFRIDIIVVALGVFGKVVIAFDQVKRGAADFAGNGIAVKFIIEGVDRTVAAVIAAAAVFVVCFFIFIP